MWQGLFYNLNYILNCISNSVLQRDAECQLPHLDNKEGKLLSMEDYNSNKKWTLRYKWWPNNKSRMYVLESTGEFVKHYNLKEKDELSIYRDGIGNLVNNPTPLASPFHQFPLISPNFNCFQHLPPCQQILSISVDRFQQLDFGRRQAALSQTRLL